MKQNRRSTNISSLDEASFLPADLSGDDVTSILYQTGWLRCITLADVMPSSDDMVPIRPVVKKDMLALAFNPRIARLFLQTSYAKRGVESTPSVISARHVKNKTDGNTV